MRILVVSDSHGNYTALSQTVRREKPDRVLHLGDGGSELEKLAAARPELPLCCVRGNCDWGSDLPVSTTLDLAGHRLFLTHGHEYGVRMSLDRLLLAAQLAGAEAALYGHTHVQHYEVRQGMTVLNPGSIGQSGAYAVLEITDAGLSCELKTL